MELNYGCTDYFLYTSNTNLLWLSVTYKKYFRTKLNELLILPDNSPIDNAMYAIELLHIKLDDVRVITGYNNLGSRLRIVAFANLKHSNHLNRDVGLILL